VNILLLSSGGGGGNILRSLNALFARDVATAHKTDPKYADRLRRALTTRFLDTNEFSLGEVPKEERVLIGADTTQRVGSRHSPELAKRALEESRSEVERLIAKYNVIVLIGTGGKGTGAGTMFPLAQMAREQRKLVLPVFVRPSFERHEVDKRRYDHALHVAEQFDAARIRLIEVLNDRAYSDSDPQPQSVVWERMNLPIARGLRGLLYVLWDLSQVDPSDLSILLAGHGRMRIGFAEIDPADDARDPDEAQINEAVRRCWHNPYCAFSKPVGTSLVCIQGDWSNLADARIKSGIAALALGGVESRPYNPLYARAFQTPKPWGVTALFTEYTGVHEPLAVQWAAKPLPTPIETNDDVLPVTPIPIKPIPVEPLPVEPIFVEPIPVEPIAVEPVVAAPVVAAVDPADTKSQPIAARERLSDRDVAENKRAFETLVEFAKALERADPAALELAAGRPMPDLPIEAPAVRKLLGTAWFRLVFPHLSPSWRDRLLAVLAENVVIPNHALRLRRRAVHLKDLGYDQLKELSAHTLTLGEAGSDLHLMIAIGQLWGEEAFTRLQFVEIAEQEDPSRLASLFGLRAVRRTAHSGEVT
jgi:cell division GTPase FtsZ